MTGGPAVLSILYQDADLVAINKPAGMHSVMLAGNAEPSVASELVAMFPECTNASPDEREGGLAHRLDRDTSGAILAARNPTTWAALRLALSGATCTKTYLAEVAGNPLVALREHRPGTFAGPDARSIVIDADIARSGRRGKRVRVGGRGRGPMAARSDITVVATRETTTLVRVTLCIGRPHQVRAHLAHIGCPVAGDDVYGAPETGALRLHALRINLLHPTLGTPLTIEAPAPDWAATAVRAQ